MSHTPSPNVHICIVQPTGYPHSLALVDPARYLRHRFEALGATVSMAKNRLRHGVPNLVLGAHLGFDRALLAEYACTFLNLEQLGQGGSAWSPAYIELLRSAPVIDYHPGNPPAYGRTADEIPLVRFGFAPYLDAAASPPLSDRPIDLLFFGSINERRRETIRRIEACGRSVTLFDGPAYGPERDAYVRQARAVLNCHFYDSARFEQVRAFQVLSLGTPVVSETSPDAASHLGFEDCVSWFDADGLEAFFSGPYADASFEGRAAAQLVRFQQAPPPADYLAALALVLAARPAASDTRPNPQRWIHAGPGEHHQLGWMNLSPLDQDQPDIALDLRVPLPLPMHATSDWRGPVALEEGASELVMLEGLPADAGAAETMLANGLRLLRPGGLLVVDKWSGPGPAPDSDESWVERCGAEFWRLGSIDHRLREVGRAWCDPSGKPTGRESARLRRIRLEKTPTTVAERTLARMHSVDFGGLLAADPAHAPATATAPSAPTSAHTPTPTAVPDAAIAGTATAQAAPPAAPATRAPGASFARPVPDPASARSVPGLPVVEVVCVAYKRYGPLQVLVQSWLNQTAGNWRLRVIHDGADERFESIMRAYRDLDPERISYHQTAERFNDYGHSLRRLGLQESSGDYVLLTNDDNYYVPRFLEFVNGAIAQGGPEVVMYDMVHSHERPGLRPLPAYSYFETAYSRGNIDMGAAVVRGDLARRAGFRDRSHDADATYFEDVARAAGSMQVAKIPRVLFVHN